MKTFFWVCVLMMSAGVSANSLEPCQDSKAIRAELRTGAACVVVVIKSEENAKLKGLAVETSSKTYCVESLTINDGASEDELDNFLEKIMCEKEDQ